MKSSLDNKTIRPGLASYNFYRSDRRPTSRLSQPSVKPSGNYTKKILVTLLIIVISSLAFVHFRSDKPDSTTPDVTPAVITQQPKYHPVKCQKNTLDRFIVISISQRKLWACQGSRIAYSSPVITGMEHLSDTRTPLGTYHIYAKQTNVTLTGSDSAGSWKDPVYYWMPFLDNQYGTYGFHDATWRAEDAFGAISPYSDKASHGCIEMPLAASKWLYDWSGVGTTVTVET